MQDQNLLILIHHVHWLINFVVYIESYWIKKTLKKKIAFFYFKSRWRIFFEWQYSKPRKSWNKNNRTFFILRIFAQSSIYCFKSFSTYSNTSVNVVWLNIISYKLTMLLCRRPFNKLTSRNAVHGAPKIHLFSIK